MENATVQLPPGRVAQANGEAGQGSSPGSEPPHSLMSIEGIAVQYGLLPLHLARETCTSDSEALIRLLGRAPRISNPWLPIGSIGPLPVLAHFNPKTEDTWGIPDFLTVKVVISEPQYEAVRKDLVHRISLMPIGEESEFEGLAKPEINPGNLKQAFDWLLASYPLDQRVKEGLKRSCDEMLEKNPQASISDYNGLQSHLGIALYHLASPGPVLVFNPDEAPRQEMFPQQLLDKHGVYPIYCGKQRVFLLSASFDNFTFEDEWLSSGQDAMEMVTVLADEKAIRKVINKYSGSGATEFDVSIDKDSFQVSDDAGVVEIIPEDVFEINPQNVNHLPEELLHWTIYQALHLRASDLHLERYYNTIRFRARIDGELKTVYSASEELLPRFVALVKNYANLGQSRQEAQDGRFALAIGKRRIDVRVAAVPCRGESQKIIMRFLEKDGGMKSIGDLHLSDRQSTLLDTAMNRDQGLVLITGPTGSGKTTTLYALLDSVNEENVNIHTIEDPIEYKVEGLNQTQTDPIHHLTFSTGLRALLRSDPDVILIGECRDEETANSAVNAALTGHLVLTTLHANDSLRAVSRLLSMEVPNYLLADSLVLSQAQRLVRTLCNYCKRPMAMPDEVAQAMVKHGVADSSVQTPIYTKTGCPECLDTGYRGRLALMELCEINQEIKDMIAEDVPLREIRKSASQQGMRSLYQEGLEKVLSGETTMDEIRGLSY